MKMQHEEILPMIDYVTPRHPVNDFGIESIVKLTTPPPSMEEKAKDKIQNLKGTGRLGL